MLTIAKYFLNAASPKHHFMVRIFVLNQALIGNNMPTKGSYTSRYVEKECLIYHYKFVLALENTITYNYTTEKFWQPLKMGICALFEVEAWFSG